MYPFGAVYASLLVVAVCAQNPPTQFDWNSILPSDKLEWVSCLGDQQCARFTVPLDHSNPQSTGEAVLALTRIPSSLSPDDPTYRGPILFNPGGPGGSGIDYLAVVRPLAALLPEYDFIGFDPRGVGHSTPQISLFGSETERALWDLTNPVVNNINASTVADGISRLWAQSQLLGQLVKDRDTEGLLQHFTTENVVRDMIRIVEAHGRTKISYYGMSYGTVIGQTLLALFPDRIERVVLDGVLDAEHYYPGNWGPQLQDSTASLQRFFDACFKAGPDKCAIYESAADKIRENVFALLESVRLNPVPVYNGVDSYGVIDYAALKVVLFQSVGAPYAVASMIANGLAELKKGNGAPLFAFLPSRAVSAVSDSANTPYTPGKMREVQIVVACNDMVEIKDTPAELMKYYEGVEEVASVFADGASFVARILCSGWKIHPQHFTGPFTAKTSFPVLLVANTADPLTPLAFARAASARLSDSVISVQDSAGHTSLGGAPNKCQIGRIASYLKDGKLPDPNATPCTMDAGMFDSPAA